MQIVATSFTEVRLSDESETASVMQRLRELARTLSSDMSRAALSFARKSAEVASLSEKLPASHCEPVALCRVPPLYQAANAGSEISSNADADIVLLTLMFVLNEYYSCGD